LYGGSAYPTKVKVTYSYDGGDFDDDQEYEILYDDEDDIEK
jgi:hypothetical protein